MPPKPTSAASAAAPEAPALPAPRYGLAWAVLVYVFGVLALGYPALAGKFLVTPISDQYIGGFPVRDFAAQSLKAGLGIPLWNPYLFGGMPYVAAMGVGDIYYPTAALRALLPVDVAMTLGLMIHVVLAGVFTFVFCRTVGLSFWASLIGGAAYMMSGSVAGLVSPGHDGKLFVSALLPLMLWFLLHGVRDGRLWAWGGLALATGLAVLSPHPQVLQYTLLTTGFFGLYLAFGEWNGTRLARRVAVSRLGIALGMVLLGGLMGAIQYAPFIGYVPWSPRAGGTAYEFATSYSFPIEELLNAYLPEFTGILDAYWGRNGIHFHSDYFGAVALVLATAAIGATGKGQALTRSFRLFVLGVLVVSLFWALGGNTPFYRLVWFVVPGTKFFRAPSTIIFVTTFAFALFVAIGAERVLAGWFSRRFVIAWAVVAAVVATLAVSGGLTNAATTVATSIATSIAKERQAPAEPYIAHFVERVEENGGAVSLGAVRSLFFVLLTVMVFGGAWRGWLSRKAAAFALLGLVAADLWSVERRYWRFSPPGAELYGSDPTIDYVKPHRDSARVLAETLSNAYAYHDPMLIGDGLMVHSIRQVRGYHGNELGRYRYLTGRRTNFDPLYSPAIRSLLNVRFLLTNVPTTDTAIRLVFGADTKLVAGPARNAAGTMVYLYQLPGDNPPAWVASGVLKAPEDAALATLHDARFDAVMHRRIALVDTGSTTRASADAAAIPPPSPVTASVRRPTHSRIDVELSAPAQDGNMLLVSENFYPGWTAKVDGRDATVERTDYTLIGVPLTAGARKVELAFTSASSRTGKRITLASAAAALLLLAAGLAQRMRPRPAASGAA